MPGECRPEPRCPPSATPCVGDHVGTRDQRQVTDDVLDVWKGLARNVRGVPIPQCGHLCQEERPDAVSTELRFLFLADRDG